MTISELIAKYELTMKVHQINRQSRDHPDSNARYYAVTMRRGDTSSFRIHFSVGPGIKGDPTIEMVVNSLILDARLRYMYSDSELASEFGIRGQSLRTLNSQITRLKDFIGSDGWAEMVDESLIDAD